MKPCKTAIPPLHTPPIRPFSPCEIVSNDTIRMLARGEPAWPQGEISDEVQALLVMILPDLMGELLARRAAMEGAL